MLPQYFIDSYISETDCALYIPLAQRMFQYFNRKVNTLNRFIKFDIVPFGMDNDLFGLNIECVIILYLGNIIKKYDNFPYKQETEYRRHDFICSIIASTLIHELFHADQIKFNKDHIPNGKMDRYDCWRTKIESSVEVKTYNYLLDHIREIETIFGFQYYCCAMTLDHDCEDYYPFIYDYDKIQGIRGLYFEVLYATILQNCFTKDDYILDDFDEMSNHIYIHVCDEQGNLIKQIPIKANGVWLEYSIPDVMNLCYEIQYSAGYDAKVAIESDTRFGAVIEIRMYPNDRKNINPFLDKVDG